MDSSKRAIIRKKKRKIWIAISVVLLIFLILLILGLTVFRAKHTITTVNSVRLKNLRVGFDIPNMGVDLNVSLNLDLSVKNPNHASFKYGNCSALLYYRGIIVGEAGIPAGDISSGEKKEMNVTLTLLADRLVSNSNVYSDVYAGTLPLTTKTKIAGRVTILGLFKHHLVTYTSCDLSVHVMNQTVGSSDCKYRSKF